MPSQRTSKGDPTKTLDRIRLHQAILVDFARVSAEATDLQRLLDLACEHAARAIGVRHSKVMRYRSEKGDLLMVAGKGWSPGTVGHARLGVDMMSAPGRCYQTREAVCVADVNDDPEFRASSLLRNHDISALLNAPIAIDGVVWGVLEVDSREADAFNEDDRQFLLALALTLALAIRHRQAQAERERNAEELGRRLIQADTFMQEQNHRVRNYFQMILSILANRSRKASGAQARQDFRDVMDRVTAVGLAHDLLTLDCGQSVVDAATYLDALCSGLERSMGEDATIERDLEPLPLRPDRAVPLGLVTNELVTNAIKYAAGDRADAAIKVRFRSDIGTREAKLLVQDNGPGMNTSGPADGSGAGDQRGGGLGLGLVRSLAGQLSGRIEIESSPAGTRVVMIFPLVE